MHAMCVLGGVLYTSCEHKLKCDHRKKKELARCCILKQHPGWTNIFVYESISKPQILSHLAWLLSQSTASVPHLRITLITLLLFLRIIIIIIFIITTCWEPLQFSWEANVKIFSDINPSPLLKLCSLFVRCPPCCFKSQIETARWQRCSGWDATQRWAISAPVQFGTRLQEQESCTLITPQPL